MKKLKTFEGLFSSIHGILGQYVDFSKLTAEEFGKNFLEAHKILAANNDLSELKIIDSDIFFNTTHVNFFKFDNLFVIFYTVYSGIYYVGVIDGESRDNVGATFNTREYTTSIDFKTVDMLDTENEYVSNFASILSCMRQTVDSFIDYCRLYDEDIVEVMSYNVKPYSSKRHLITYKDVVLMFDDLMYRNKCKIYVKLY